MRLSRIEIQAFGCLSDFSEEIGPALHIFHGPNESGKSTLQQAILALLYGFYEDESAKAGNAARKRFVPWQQPRYAARLDYELGDGRRYRITRDFANDDVPTAVSDLVTGRTVTDEFGRGRHGNVPFMRKQLGMNRRVFESCAFVAQGELLQITGKGRVTPQEIGDAIISLADTARRDVSAQKALEHLSEAVKNQIGGPTARVTPLPLARNALAAAKRELEEIDSVRAEVAADAQALEQARERARTLDETVTRNRYLLALAEATDIRTLINRLRELDEQSLHFQQQLEANIAFAAFPADERDEVVRAWNSVRELRERLVNGQAETERQRRRLEELNERRESLAQRERDLSRLRQYPAERQPDIDALAQHWRQAELLYHEAQARLAAADDAAQPLREEYDSLAPEVGALTPADVEAITMRLAAASDSGRGGAGRAILAALGRLLRAAGRAVAATARALFRRGRSAPPEAGTSPAADGPVSSLPRNEATRLLQAHMRYLEIAPIIRKFDSEQAANERAGANRAAASSRLRLALEGLADDLADLESAYAQFSQRAAARRQLDTVTDQLASLDGERESLRETVNRFVSDGERLRKLEAGLLQHLSAALGREGKLEELLEAFEAGCGKRQLHQEAARSLREIENGRGLLLEGRSPVELDEMLTAREHALSQFVAENPSLKGARAASSRDALAQAVTKQAKELQQLELQIEAMRTRIDTRSSGLRPRAEVEEEIQQRLNEVADLERFGSALVIARELIEQAMTEAHRDFAPSVGRFLSDGLAQVTGGRYQRAMLDPATFRVTTEVPETGRLEDVDLLSQGTQAAAYLLLRVGLAQHMSSMSEPVPLLLDDPLVDLDDVRIEHFLDRILELSRDIQILLFTKDESTRAWFGRRCAADTSCEITHLEALRQRIPAVLPRFAAIPAMEQASFLTENGAASSPDHLTGQAP